MHGGAGRDRARRDVCTHEVNVVEAGDSFAQRGGRRGKLDLDRPEGCGVGWAAGRVRGEGDKVVDAVDDELEVVGPRRRGCGNGQGQDLLMGAAGDRAGDEIAQRFVVLRPELALPIDQAQAGGKALARREPG